jgi:hypothetical protein
VVTLLPVQLCVVKLNVSVYDRRIKENLPVKQIQIDDFRWFFWELSVTVNIANDE